MLNALLPDLGIRYEVVFLPWESIGQNSCVVWLFLPKIQLMFETAALLKVTVSYDTPYLPSFYIFIHLLCVAILYVSCHTCGSQGTTLGIPGTKLMLLGVSVAFIALWWNTVVKSKLGKSEFILAYGSKRDIVPHRIKGIAAGVLQWDQPGR